MDTITDQQIAADLRATVRALNEHGWTQGEYRDVDTGAMCALGAARYVTLPPTFVEVNRDELIAIRPAGFDRYAALNDVLEDAAELLIGDAAVIDDPFAPTDGAVAIWNDSYCTTAAEVTALMAHLADRLDPPKAG